MSTKKTLAAFAAAVALTTLSYGPVDLAATTRAHADTTETRPMSTREFNRWKRNWDRRIEDLVKTDETSYAWGREKRPIKSQVMVLDPPLVKTGAPHKVSVEWFFVPIDERSDTLAWKAGSVGVFKWMLSIRKAGEDDIELVIRPVSKGPGAHPRFERVHRTIQDMLYAWEGNAWDGQSRQVYLQINSTKIYLGTITEEQAKELIGQTGLDTEEWMARRSRPETAARAERANARFAEVMRQAAEQNVRYLKTPQDPIILIDGKYLLTGYMAKRTKRQFQMANRIIRERLEQRPMHGFDQSRIAWGNEREPRGKEVIELRGSNAKPRPNVMEVEWFFTYVTDDGQVSDTAWLDRQFEFWKTSAQLEGVNGIRIKRSPVARLTRQGSRHFAEHQRLHQELVMAWGEDIKGWRGRMHQFVGEIELARKRAPRSIGTEAAARALIEGMVVPMERYEYEGFVAEREARREALARLTERGVEAGEAATRRSRSRASSRHVQPIVVVDGRYVMSAESAGSVENLFQILNWMARQRLGQG